MEISKISIEKQLLIKYYVIVCNTAKSAKYDGYQHGLASRVYNFFDKKTNFNLLLLE